MVELLDQSFPARSEDLSAVRTAVRQACQRANGSAEFSEQMVLAINEACMNVIKHGYGFAPGQSFTLRLHNNDDVLIVHLLDNGLPATDADLHPRELHELRPGGLGVRFMRELMDGVAYQPPPEGYVNCLQLSKRIY